MLLLDYVGAEQEAVRARRTKLSQTTWDNENNVDDPRSRRAQFSVADSQKFVDVKYPKKGRSLARGDLRSIRARPSVGRSRGCCRSLRSDVRRHARHAVVTTLEKRQTDVISKASRRTVGVAWRPSTFKVEKGREQKERTE
jgi:hypothetical protein